MFEGLKTMDKLVSDNKNLFLQEWKEKLEKWKEPQSSSSSDDDIPRSLIVPTNPPKPPTINTPILV